MKSNKETRIGIRIEPELRERLQRESDKQHSSYSRIMRIALLQYLAQQENSK